MRQMIQHNKTGEVLVIDTTTNACTPSLTPEEQTAPLSDYELDYSVIKATR